MLHTAENYYRSHTAKMHRLSRRNADKFTLASVLRNKAVGSTEGWGPVDGWPDVPHNGHRRTPSAPYRLAVRPCTMGSKRSPLARAAQFKAAALR